PPAPRPARRAVSAEDPTAASSPRSSPARRAARSARRGRAAARRPPAASRGWRARRRRPPGRRSRRPTRPLSRPEPAGAGRSFALVVDLPVGLDGVLVLELPLVAVLRDVDPFVGGLRDVRRRARNGGEDRVVERGHAALPP